MLGPDRRRSVPAEQRTVAATRKPARLADDAAHLEAQMIGQAAPLGGDPIGPEQRHRKITLRGARAQAIKRLDHLHPARRAANARSQHVRHGPALR